MALEDGSEALSRTGAVKVKALEWEDNYAFAPEWGGHYHINYLAGRRAFSLSAQGFPDGPSGYFDSKADAKAAAQADYERRILSVLEPAAPTEPDFASTIAAVIKDECDSGAAAGWRSCTGCHETNEGYETGRYPYSTMFGCHVGHGCSECGGLGVVWDYWSKDALEAMVRDDEPTAPSDEDRCPVCDEPFKPGDQCASDIEMGMCHAQCLEGTPTVNLDTGEPEDGPIPAYPYEPTAPEGDDDTCSSCNGSGWYATMERYCACADGLAQRPTAPEGETTAHLIDGLDPAYGDGSE